MANGTKKWFRGKHGSGCRLFSVSGLSKALLLTGLLILSGCAGPDTKVEDVWMAPESGGYSLGKTMVIVYTRTPVVSDMVERALVRQLQEQGVTAVAWHTTMPGVSGPDRAEIVPIAVSGEFMSVLTVNVLEVKQVERDFTATQVARGETKVFSVASQRLVWAMVADTYFRTMSGVDFIVPEESAVREFSTVLVAEMRHSGLM